MTLRGHLEIALTRIGPLGRTSAAQVERQFEAPILVIQALPNSRPLRLSGGPGPWVWSILAPAWRLGYHAGSIEQQLEFVL